MTIGGLGIFPGAKIQSLDPLGHFVIMDHDATSSNVGATYTFGPPYLFVSQEIGGLSLTADHQPASPIILPSDLQSIEIVNDDPIGGRSISDLRIVFALRV
jgi:hypothetical protein